MNRQIAILHGWSDNSKSFRPLRSFLADRGFEMKAIWLGDYVSKDDDVRIEDAARRMQEVVSEKIASGELKAPFDLIVHSTGGLVAREWLVANYPDGKGAPIKRLIMLAPANFGSRLASLGKSMIGRIAKGWNNWLETGKGMLDALELGSAYQRRLALRDLFDQTGGGAEGPYGARKVWPFVITGTRGYPSMMRQIVNEQGADGTVRAAAANLNAIGMTLDFSENGEIPALRAWTPRAGDFPFPFAALADRDHTSVTLPEKASGAAAEDDRLGELLLEALGCDSAEAYRRIEAKWRALSEATAGLARDPEANRAFFGGRPPAGESFRQHMQIVAHVRDDHGASVDDYFIEFFSPDQGGVQDIVLFQREVLRHVHVNKLDASMRCLYIDREALRSVFYQRYRRLAVSLSADAPGRNVAYFDAEREGARGDLVIHARDEEALAELGPERLLRNKTHFVDIVIPRRPKRGVFKLNR
ncbi:MAG: hypothetical protein EA385_02985 [Salinarimonadaceae bacterium]|nr:MAG: hypothetical protein EA385_02985 [Salinarimonadaceae bacterium]